MSNPKSSAVSIDSLLGEDDDMLSEIQIPKQKTTAFNGSEDSVNKEILKPDTTQPPVQTKEMASQSGVQNQNKEKANDFSWLIPVLAGAGGTIVIQKIIEQFSASIASPKETEDVAGIQEFRKKSRAVDDEKESRKLSYRHDDFEIEPEIKTRQSNMIHKAIIDKNQYTDFEFINIPQDLIIGIVQQCNEANIKLLLNSASERSGTIKGQFLYEKENRYALNTIADIKKSITELSDYYYFDQPSYIKNETY